MNVIVVVAAGLIIFFALSALIVWRKGDNAGKKKYVTRIEKEGSEGTFGGFYEIYEVVSDPETGEEISRVKLGEEKLDNR